VSGFSATAAGLISLRLTSAVPIDRQRHRPARRGLATLRTKSQTLSANLSVITARQDFTTNMINALTIGADNLTAADTNEEGANMLMLQTRQSLGTTSLSLASQAAQSVLQLF
jgi:flagellin-like hook-associated protein FlgL